MRINHFVKFIISHPKLSLVLVVFIGFLIRFLSIFRREIWYDEAYTSLLVDQSWPDMLETMRFDVHPPLYYALLKIWVEIFSNTEFTIRLFSLISGVLLIIVAYYVTKRIFIKSSYALVVAYIFAISPFFVEYSVEARTYMFLSLIFMLIVYYAYDAAGKLPLRFSYDWLILSVLVTMSFFLHYVSVFGILVLTMYFSYKWYISLKDKKANKNELLMDMISFAFVPTVSFILWFPVFAFQLSRNTNLGWIPTADLSMLSNTVYAVLFGANIHQLGVTSVNEIQILESATIGTIILLTIFAFLVRSYSNRKLPYGISFILTFSMLPIILVILASDLISRHFYLDRYIIGYLSVLVILIGFVIVRILEIKKTFILLSMYTLLVLFNWPATGNFGYREISNNINIMNISNEDLIIVTDPIHSLSIKYYVDDAYKDRVKILDIDKKSGYSGWALIDASDIVDSVGNLPGSIWIDNKNIIDQEIYIDKFEKIDSLGEFTIYRQTR